MREMLFLSCLCFFACTSLSTTEPVLIREVLGRSFYQVPEGRTPLRENLGLVFDWQKREKESRLVGGDVASAPYPYVLRDEYNGFSRPARRALANKAVAWVQDLSKKYYLNDLKEDYWPTTNEFLSGPGDDCDGLELLLYTFLLDHGFGETNVYRAVIGHQYERHMVTLWFEDPGDPWVLDPTGQAAPKEPRKLSNLPDWNVVVMFNREESYAPSEPVY